MPLAEVFTLNETNFRDPAATLRRVADQIEAGEYGEVNHAGLVIHGETLEVFGMGKDSEAESVAMLLHAGFMRMSVLLGY